MAAPVLQAEGSIAAITTGDLTVTLPAHQTNDILIVSTSLWAPNTAGNFGNYGYPSGWVGFADIANTAAVVDGRLIIAWKRATSGAETNPTFTRPSGTDTGTDTCWAGCAYVVRGCITTGNPWDAVAKTADPGYTTANQTFPAVTVSGNERMVVQFLCSADNQAAGAAPSGWTEGTAVTTTTGTDAGFQTFRKDNISSSTSADASATSAPAQGSYGFFGVSFKPPDLKSPPFGNINRNYRTSILTR